MGTNEQLIEQPAPEDQLVAIIEKLLAAQSEAPINPDWPRYWYHEIRYRHIPGVLSSAQVLEGAVKTTRTGERVDVHSNSSQVSVLGIKRPLQKNYTVTRWDQAIEGYHKLEIDLSKGSIAVTSKAQDPKDRGVILPLEKISFQRGMPEYEGALQSSIALLGELDETG